LLVTPLGAIPELGIEVPDNMPALEVLENTRPFPARQWPEKIDRGWVEYVHVRYGRSPCTASLCWR
jgi:hypothetical protein